MRRAGAVFYDTAVREALGDVKAIWDTIGSQKIKTGRKRKESYEKETGQFINKNISDSRRTAFLHPCIISFERFRDEPV